MRNKDSNRKIKSTISVSVILLFALISAVSCAADTTVNDYFFPYSILEQFESFFAQVTFTSPEMVYPSVYTEDGQNYLVAVINGFENPEDAETLTGTLEIKDGIMAINSKAFEKADNVTEIILPSSCQSLGVTSLPQRAERMTMSLEAATDLVKAINDSEKDNLKELTVNGSGLATITGNFYNLETVTVNGTYWPNLPTLSKDGVYFGGWVDSNGNKIIGGTRITSSGHKATPVWTTNPTPTPVPGPEPTPDIGGMGFLIPYITMATGREYALKYTNNGDGTYSFTPSTTAVGYELKFDNNEYTGAMEEGRWIVSVTRLGTHIFSVFYLDAAGNPIGFGQVTWSATTTI